MNIVYVADIEASGGATACLVGLVGQMAAWGHRSTVLLERESGMRQVLESLGARCVVTGHGSFLQARPAGLLKRLAKRPIRYLEYRRGFGRSIARAEQAIDFSQVDVIHTNVNRVDLGAELACRYRIPHLWHLREFSDIDFGCWSYRRDWVKYLATHAEHIVTVSQAVKDHYVAKGIPADRMEVVNDGVDVDAFREVPRHCPGPVLELALVGGVCPAKGQASAIEALAMLPETYRRQLHVTFWGGGDGGYVRLLARKARRLGVGGMVRFAGWTDDVPGVLARSDAGLMCSENEAFGLVTVEYLAAGLPVVVSDSGANREFLDAGAVGLSYRVDDARDLARALEQLLDHREAICKQATSENVSLARRQWSCEGNAYRILGIYRGLARRQ